MESEASVIAAICEGLCARVAELERTVANLKWSIAHEVTIKEGAWLYLRGGRPRRCYKCKREIADLRGCQFINSSSYMCAGCVAKS